MKPLPTLFFFLVAIPLLQAAAGDARFEPPRTLDSYHPFRGGADSVEAWAARSEAIVRRVKLASGIWPEPTKTPLQAVVHGRRDFGDYSIEKVYFQSMPGHYVTGNLYRPAGASLKHGGVKGKRPGILCPHGHWREGRFLDQGSETRVERQVKFALATGAERFVSAARSPLQARCVQLARMGCVVFHYDMLANADSVQFLSHKITPREHMNSTKTGEWGFAGPAAAARLQTSFGLQTWNSVRAVDFVLALGDVDPDRLAVTGASGGGTQTMMLAAVDARIDAAFPCVMPSTAMQGGCTCENTHLLRIGQGNIDISAATAPRPLGITAADDWSIELETKGHPDLVSLYKMLGQPKRYEAHFDIHFKHNYNHVSRTHMYNFMNRHLGLGLEAPVLERDFEYQDAAALTVWDDAHPRPSGPEVGDTHERALCAWWTRDATRQLRPLLQPADAAAAAKAREVLGGAWDGLIGRTPPSPSALDNEILEKTGEGGWMKITSRLRHLEEGEEVSVTWLYPENWNEEAVLWVHPDGAAGAFDADGSPRVEVLELLDAGYTVAAADLFLQGNEPRDAAVEAGFREKKNGRPRNRDVSAGKEIREGLEWRRHSLFSYGYNHPVFAQRVHDLMAVAAFIKSNQAHPTSELTLMGVEGGGRWAVAAAAVSGWRAEPVVDRVVADLRGFRFATVADEWDPDFLPGGAKYGDVAGLGALTVSAGTDLWLASADKAAVTAVQKTAGVAVGAGEAEIYDGARSKVMESALRWVVKGR